MIEGLRTAEVKPFTEFPPREIGWLLGDKLGKRVPVGALSLVVGAAGSGKSTWVTAVAAAITGDGADDQVLFIGAEDSPSQVLVPRMLAAGGKINRCHMMSVSVNNVPGVPLLPTDVELIRHQVLGGEGGREGRKRLVVLDTLAGHIDGSIDTNNDPSLRRALIPFARMLEETGTTAIAIMHQNKNAKAGTLLNSINGGTAYGGVARSVLVFGHIRGKEAGDDRLIVHAKSNYSRKQPALVTRMLSRHIDKVGDMSYCGIGTADEEGEDLA